MRSGLTLEVDMWGVATSPGKKACILNMLSFKNLFLMCCALKEYVI